MPHAAKKLLFLNPSVRESDVAKHVPLGELWLSACMEQWYDIQTALFDLNALRSELSQNELDEELQKAVSEEDWSAIGIGGITTTYNSIKRILQIIRPLTDAPIILGGGGFTAQPHEWMQLLPQVDVGVFGEAFHSLGEVMQHSEDMEFRKVKGTFYRKPNGEITTSGERPLIPDMDVLPLPNYDLAPLNIYFKNSSVLLSEEAMTAHRRLDYAASTNN